MAPSHRRESYCCQPPALRAPATPAPHGKAQKLPPPPQPWVSMHSPLSHSDPVVQGSKLQARSMQAQPLSTTSARAQNPSGSQSVATPAAQFSAVSPVGQVVSMIGRHAPASALQKVPSAQQATKLPSCGHRATGMAPR